MPKSRTIAAAAVTALLLGAAAGSADAQGYRGDNRGYDYNHRDYDGGPRSLTSSYVDSLEWRIDNAAQERRLSWGEARELKQQLRQIQGAMIYRVENGRANDWEIRRVNNVVRRIEAATRGYARNDGRYGDDRRNGYDPREGGYRRY